MIFRKKKIVQDNDIDTGAYINNIDQHRPFLRTKMSKKALVLLAEGAEEMEVVITVDVLRRGGIETVIAGLAGFSLCECSRGVKIFPDALLDDAVKKGPYDIVIVPGGAHGAEALALSEKVGAILKEQDKRGGWIGAICAGPVALDRHDVGKGSKAEMMEGTKFVTLTSHPSVEEVLDGYFYSEARVCVCRNFITARGPGCAFDFALKIVEILQGPEIEEATFAPMILPERDPKPPFPNPEVCPCDPIQYTIPGAEGENEAK